MRGCAQQKMSQRFRSLLLCHRGIFLGRYGMTVISLTRCQFLMPFAEIHSEIGGPTSELLAKFKLPISLEEKADHYVPMLQVVRFATAAQETQSISEIAFRSSQRLAFEHLSEALRLRIRHSPTLLVALQQVFKWAPVRRYELVCLAGELQRELERLQQDSGNGGHRASRDVPVASKRLPHTHYPPVRRSSLDPGGNRIRSTLYALP